VINCKLSDKAQWGDFREGFCGANKKADLIEKPTLVSRNIFRLANEVFRMVSPVW